MRALALAVLLATSAASAQTVVQIKPPPEPEPPIGFRIELKMGTLIPRVGDEPGLSSSHLGRFAFTRVRRPIFPLDHL